jgi:CheY-like chemotaxis protein
VHTGHSRRGTKEIGALEAAAPFGDGVAGYMGGVGDLPEPMPMTGDGSPDSAERIRRSAELVQALDEVITDQQRALSAADAALERTHRVLQDVDVDLAAFERRRSDQPPPAARVLVVDDNPSIREVLRLLLELECADTAEVRTVGSGADAVEAAAWLPHVVILDWQMPEMDGLETARRLRALLGDEPRLVMYSAALAVRAESEALDAGADVYLEKGAEVEVLVDAVKDAVARRDRRRRSTSR